MEFYVHDGHFSGILRQFSMIFKEFYVQFRIFRTFWNFFLLGIFLKSTEFSVDFVDCTRNVLVANPLLRCHMDNRIN